MRSATCPSSRPAAGRRHRCPCLHGARGPRERRWSTAAGWWGPGRRRTVTARGERAAAELAVLDRAVAAGLPVLGICRGAQLLDVAGGGTLHQHLPEVVGYRLSPCSTGGSGAVCTTV